MNFTRLESKDSLERLYPSSLVIVFKSQKIFGLEKIVGPKKLLDHTNCGSIKIVGPKNVWVQKIFWVRKQFRVQKNNWVWKYFRSKKLLVRKILRSKIFWSIIIFGPKKFLVEKFFPKKCWFQKNVKSKKMLGPKKFWVQKIFCSEQNFALKKFVVSKIFDSKKIVVRKIKVQKNKFRVQKKFGS